METRNGSHWEKRACSTATIDARAIARFSLGNRRDLGAANHPWFGKQTFCYDRSDIRSASKPVQVSAAEAGRPNLMRGEGGDGCVRERTSKYVDGMGAHVRMCMRARVHNVLECMGLFIAHIA